MTKVIGKKDEGVNLSTKQKATSSKELASDQAKNSPKEKTKKKLKISKMDIYFTIFVLAWVLLTTITSQYIVALPMSIILGEALQDPGWMLLYYTLTYAVTLVLLIMLPPRLIKLIVSRNKKTELRAAKNLIQDLEPNAVGMGVQHLPTFVDIGLAPIGYVIYIFIAMVLTSLMNVFPWFNADQSQDVGFGYFVTDLDRIFAMLAVVFLAPIVEELIMRGWLYGKVREKWNIPISAVLVSLLFAVLHGQWNVGVSTFALSLVLCGLREITGTIWSGILLHVLSNGIAFYLLYVAI